MFLYVIDFNKELVANIDIQDKKGKGKGYVMLYQENYFYRVLKTYFTYET